MALSSWKQNKDVYNTQCSLDIYEFSIQFLKLI
jgi:hypothetical protein